jgi:1,4-dihydroxy-2-naphthoyl-CoA hydrolase
MKTKLDASFFNPFGAEYLPGLVGVVVKEVATNYVLAEMPLEKKHFAPNGYVHAGSIVTLADTACGYGCFANLPEDATSFTTIELKTNFMGTAKDGVVLCEAKAIHTGRNTQVWDATVTHHETSKLIATFRCTQMILWPK